MTATSSEMQERDVMARTVAGFCAAYGISKAAVYRLIGNGELRMVKYGRRTLILEDSAREWLERLEERETG